MYILWYTGGVKEMNNLLAINATDARKAWSLVVDQVIREKPKFIKRTRDYMILSDVRFLEVLLSGYFFSAERFIEEDGSITLSLNEIDIVENGKSEEEAKQKLAQSIIDYAEDFYNDFQYWATATNRKSQIPYVFKALILDDANKIGEQIRCRDGKN